jgi:O-antigen/teichoic acid export membrane protein
MIAVTPVLSRLYGPSDIAVLSVLVALASPLGMIATLRWDAAVPLPSGEGEVAGLLTLGLLSVVTCAGASALAIWFAFEPITSLVGVRKPHLLAAIPMMVVAIGMTQLLTQLAIRHNRYVATGRSKAAQAVSAASLQVALPFLRAGGTNGLVGGYLAGQVIGALVLFPGMLRHRRHYGRGRPGVELLRRYVHFPLLLVPSTLINAVGLQLPVLLIATSYSADDTGTFAMAMRVVTIPVTVIGLAAGQVFLGTIAVTIRASGSEALRFFDRASRWLLIVGLLVSGVLVAAGPPLFELALGHNWRTSGEVARFLALMVATQLVASPLASTLTVLERPGLQFLLDTSRIVGLLIAFHLATWQGASVVEAAFSMSVVTAMFYLAYWTVSRLQLIAYTQKGSP